MHPDWFGFEVLTRKVTMPHHYVADTCHAQRRCVGCASDVAAVSRRYDVDSWDHTVYKRPRFMSEFGLQSWPSALTMATVFPSDQWNYDSDMSTSRNHHWNGQQQMVQQISMHFHLPASRTPAGNQTPVASTYGTWSQVNPPPSERPWGLP